MATITSEQQQRKSSTSPTLTSILNDKLSVDTPMKDYLPTPVTPASDFSQFNKKDTSAYSTFSVIKPPTSAATPTTPVTTARVATGDVKPYPCPECHQTLVDHIT